MYTVRKKLADWLLVLIRLIDPARTLVVNTTCTDAAEIEKVALERAGACFGPDGKYTIVPGYTVKPDVYMHQFTGKFTAVVTVREG
ncbi:hypothetical protein OG979_16145 [Actinomadura citrea]|uniref:hypothetical protein n=1 Tax=Actinomadura citrea TaxID=46158 RepID=UPI002E2AE278|nr:hypothetical protein [Actinomadura citrea]